MELKINGKKENLDIETIEDLIEKRDLDPAGIVVEHNKDIVKKENWDEKEVKHGDQIELISFVGGG